MEIKAKDMCPRCKHCLGMTHQGMYSCGKANDGSELNIGIDVILNCANFEWKDGKVEGKVSDFCPKCKNCKGTTNEYDGNDFVVITGVECEDPYDGMTKTLDADSDICCSMFELKKEKEPFHLNMPREAIKTIAKLNDIICELEKEKAAHLKGIERLKKSQEKLQNQVKNLQTTNEESYKREEKSELLEEKLKNANEVADSWKRDYERLRDQFVHPIYNILYPDNPNLDINVTKLLNYVKDLKVYYEENRSMYKEVQEAMKKNTKLNQTISDQEITIKALLITIKEMCKED